MFTNLKSYSNLFEQMEEAGEWTDFAEIPEFLVQNLIANNFPTPFPVQSAVISNFFSSDRDLAIGFPTGSGKHFHI